MAISDRIRELDEQVAQAVRRAVDDLREEVRRRLDEATSELQRRLGEVAPELPESFVSEEDLRRIAEEAAAPTSEALEQAREEGRAQGRTEGRAEGQSLGRAEGRVEGQSEGEHQGRQEVQESLRDAIAGIDRAGSQAEVLEALLAAASRHAGRAALLLVREGRLAGWGALGFDTDPDLVRSVSLTADDQPWSGLLAGGGPEALAGARCAPLVSQLDSPLPREGAVVPLVLRDRVAAVLYADRPEDGRLDLTALQLLAYTAALALETLAFRQRSSTATLAAPAGAGAAPFAAAAEEPSAVEEPPAVGEPPAAEDAWAEPAEPWSEPGEAWSELEAPELEETAAAAPPAEPEALLTAEPEAQPAAQPAEETWELPDAPELYRTPPHGDELLEAVEEEEPPAEAGAPFDEGAFEEAALEEAPALEAGEERFEEAPAEEGYAAAGGPETGEVAPAETIAWRTEPEEAVEEPEEAVEEPEVEELEAEPVEPAEAVEVGDRPEAGAVPPPPPAPPGAGGQVAPPEDVEGPGWAFSASRGAVPKDAEAAHEEARRLARLLVSEIQLYNQEQVDEGRRNRDIYERLRDDIDRSRQLYEDRVESGIRETTDYFYQELVRQLAAGDAKALGI